MGKILLFRRNSLMLIFCRATVIDTRSFNLKHDPMFLVVFLILIVAWVLGFTLRIAGAFIHIALVFAILSFIAHLLRGKAVRV